MYFHIKLFERMKNFALKAHGSLNHLCVSLFINVARDDM